MNAGKVGTTVDGKYELIRLLGEGGMGVVYEARHLLIGRQLAVKFLHLQYAANQELVTRFHREARAAAAIGHDHIIEVTDMGKTSEGEPYIVMEYLDGHDLKQILAEEVRLPEERAAFIMVQALSALQAAHDVGIIHRDIKPENIYLLQKGDVGDYVKLLDFGVSKFHALETDEAKGLTQTGTVLGTPYYMSPEQARGVQDLSSKSDIYAMGVILYQMVTGRLPYDAPNYNALLMKIITEDPVEPTVFRPDLSPQMASLIMKAMARNPDDRFIDCIDFRQQLMRFAPEAGSLLAATMGTGARAAMNVPGGGNDLTLPVATTRNTILRAAKRSPLLLAAIFLGLALPAFFVLWALAGGDDDGGPSQGGRVESVAALAAVPIAVSQGSAGLAKSEEGGQIEDTGSVTPEVNSPVAPLPVDDTEQEISSSSDEKPGDDAAMVQVRIVALPETATIKVDGFVLEGNPFVGDFQQGIEAHKVEVIADGFEAVTALVTFDADKELIYKLVKPIAEPVAGELAIPKDRATKRVKTKTRRANRAAKKRRKKPRRKIDDADPWS